MAPMRASDRRSCEAGTKGGNSEHGRESRRAELDMDRNTNPRPTRRQSVQAQPLLMGLPKIGTGGEMDRCSSLSRGTLATTPAESGVLRPATNGNQERDNPVRALTGVNVSRSSIASPGGAGLPQKQMSPGKPADMPTEAR
jgi:hypothetical protein